MHSERKRERENERERENAHPHSILFPVRLYGTSCPIVNISPVFIARERERERLKLMNYMFTF